MLLGGALRVIPFTLFGTYAAWAYLRFLQSRDGVRCVSASALAAAVLAAMHRHLPGGATAGGSFIQHTFPGACPADFPRVNNCPNLLQGRPVGGIPAGVLLPAAAAATGGRRGGRLHPPHRSGGGRQRQRLWPAAVCQIQLRNGGRGAARHGRRRRGAPQVRALVQPSECVMLLCCWRLY